MTLTVHLTDRYVYLCENRPPRVGEHYINPSNPDAFFRRGYNEDEYIETIVLLATNERLALSNLSQSDADYIRSNGLKEVEIESQLVPKSISNDHWQNEEVPTLTPEDTVIVVREEVKKSDSPWIDVNDRLPATNIELGDVYTSDTVLVSDGFLTDVAHYSDDEKWTVYSRYNHVEPTEITHWMPMPANPANADKK